MKRYQVSPRTFPEALPTIEYDSSELVRLVNEKGKISFKGRMVSVGKGFRGYPVALRPTDKDGVWKIFFCNDSIAQVDFNSLN